MEEIRQYSERANLFDDPPDYRGPSPDSILNIAVGYPEALEHLISLGANPNQANDFGKTPLMYAAQHNALESGRILLEADADPNAKTIWPKNNSCFYTLRTAAMTPLHYAVRYASPEFINMLLAAGAETHIATFTKEHNRDREYAIDWLARYASEGAEEPNPYIDTNAYKELQNKLAVPDIEARTEIARKLTLEAEVAYQSGNEEDAYMLIKDAFQANSEYIPALIIMSSLAFEMGFRDEAAYASRKVIASSDDTEVLANTWLNLGRACQRGGTRYNNGEELCHQSRVYYYYKTWELNPTEDNKNQLINFFSERHSLRSRLRGAENSVCEFENSDTTLYLSLIHI